MLPSTLDSIRIDAADRPRWGRAFWRALLQMLLTITPMIRPRPCLASPVRGSASYGGRGGALLAAGADEAAGGAEAAPEEAAASS